MSGENAAHEPRTTFDWLSSDYPYALTPFQQSVINASWQTSPLGPIESWPQQLRQMTLLIIADEHPACLFWGKENTLIYNEAYTVLVGALHPALQGQDPCAAFQGELKHICQNFDDIFGIQQRTGRAALTENSLILLNRHGYEEETYFSSKYVPIIGKHIPWDSFIDHITNTRLSHPQALMVQLLALMALRGRRHDRSMLG